jgi:hypothetical protein
MRRSFRSTTLALVGTLALGCQNYNFNPVKRCLIQPGSEKVTLSKISTADVLFVVDDSGSMGGEQAKLAAAFDAFVTELNRYNDERRVASGLEPFDFHIAMTTTSVFNNRPSGIQTDYVFPRQTKACTSAPQCAGDAPYTACVQGCGGFAGSVCCTPPKTCGSDADCAFPAYVCGECAGQSGVCCSAPTGGHPQGQPEFVLACTPGIAEEGTPYPRGSFVGLGSNPRVLHFDKELYGVKGADGLWDPPLAGTTSATNKQGFTRAQLRNFFASNVNVGTCGSGQEQGLQAARLAVSKALSGQQRDMRNASGTIVSAPGVTADWPHAGAKLVVIYVGDEDDCSAPEDPVRGIVLTGVAGSDACVEDTAKPLEDQKQFRVDDIVRDLAALNRPLGAAFIVSTQQGTCTDAGCTAGICCDRQCTGSSSVCTTSTCGGQAAGTRLVQAASAFRQSAADVVEGSICDPGAKACSVNADCASFAGATCVDGCGESSGKYCCLPSGALAGTTGFGSILARIAEIVKPPSALMLPTQPADAAVTMLRITNGDGITRKICKGPAKPPLTLAQASAQGYDWWFTETREQITDAQKTPWGPSRYVYINQETNNCVPNPGETYSADYVGMVPAGGCRSHQDCTDALGALDPANGEEWTCFAGLATDGTCTPPSATAVGTCLCGGRAAVCPKG